MTIKQTRDREKWSKKTLFSGLDDWKKIWFSDEGVFCVILWTSRCSCMMNKANAYEENCMKQSVEFLAKVVVWPCMAANGSRRTHPPVILQRLLKF